ncbi:MAG: transporter substrate-binding domain-containing protein [Coriobacteriia bacterium]|nr:transporter substrate-binding domain-containing protein [Coriobacteriia bacterium]
MADMLGPYELRGELGRGAMAVVWRAFDTKLEREVAIKEPVIPANADATVATEFAARFVREGKAAAQLNHPGIVTIYAADIYDGHPAIVMELIEGQTLGDVLAGGAVEPQSTHAVLDQLLDAVGYAHSKGVVHRDIKPDNVFITHDGRVKLADFGIAHVGSSATLTQAGTIMGTPGYMAPEQVTGQPIDARADLFAIGVIAYEMLAGKNPFGELADVAPTTIMYRIVHEPAVDLPPEAFAGAADLPPAIMCALAKDPVDRFASASEFRTALGGGPLPTRSHPATAATAGFSPAPTTTSAGSSHPRRNGWLPYAIVIGLCAALLGGFMFATGGPGGKGASKSAGAPSGSTGRAPSAPATPAATYKLVTPGKLTVGSDLDFPPMEQLNGDQPEGFDVELMTAIAKEMGLEINYLPPQKFDELIPRVNAGKFDVIASSLTINHERTKKIIFSAPYFEVKQAIAMKEGSTLNALEDLKDKKLGVQSGTSQEWWATENLKREGVIIVPFKKTSQTFAALQADTVDAVLAELPATNMMVKDPAKKLAIVWQNGTMEMCGFGVAMENPDLAFAINQALAKIIESGEYKSIYEKWIGPYEP